MASIAFDAFGAGTTVSPGTGPITWSHTCNGSDRLLLVHMCVQNSNLVTAITYNGVSMTKLLGPTGLYATQEIWGLLNPATGSNTVSVTFTGNIYVGGCSTSYTGVKQTGLPDASTSGDATQTTTITATLTTVATRTWMVMNTFANVQTPTAGTGQTSRGTLASRQMLVGDSNGDLSPGSNAMTTNGGGGLNNFNCVAVSIADSTAEASSGSMLLMFA